jgi:hypothetical protein
LGNPVTLIGIATDLPSADTRAGYQMLMQMNDDKAGRGEAKHETAGLAVKDCSAA